MSDLVKCIRCDKTMIDEEYTDHRCVPQIKVIKTIKYDSFFINHDLERGEILEVRAMDGTHYEFVKVPVDKESTKIPYQPRGNTENNNREGNRIRFEVLSSSWDINTCVTHRYMRDNVNDL